MHGIKSCDHRSKAQSVGLHFSPTHQKGKDKPRQELKLSGKAASCESGPILQNSEPTCAARLSSVYFDRPQVVLLERLQINILSCRQLPFSLHRLILVARKCTNTCYQYKHEADSLNQFKSLLKMYFADVSLAESLFMGLSWDGHLNFGCESIFYYAFYLVFIEGSFEVIQGTLGQ